MNSNSSSRRDSLQDKRAAYTSFRNGSSVGPGDRQQGPPEPVGITAAELAIAEFEPLAYAVDGLLPEGLTVLGGKPKGGKSWLALLLGWAVAVGCDLDGRAVRQGEVLYLALEDTRRRLQKRLLSLRSALGWTVPGTLHLYTDWPRSDNYGLICLGNWISQRKDTARLVIVDTLAKFRPPVKGNGNSYADDYEAVGGLKKLLDQYGVAGLLVHHTRKLRAEDPFDEISGTLAIAGAADSLWVLDTEEKGVSTRLYLTGRDLPDATVPMAFHKESGRWTLGPARDGIDTAGRLTSPAEGRVHQARQWLRDFLREFAHPCREVDDAGKAAGFSPSAIREAKAQLGREGTGELWFSKDGQSQWWCGLGRPSTWKRRPAPGSAEEIPD